jgi:hypothetical protein
MVPLIATPKPRRAIEDSDLAQSFGKKQGAIMRRSDACPVRDGGGGVSEKFYHVYWRSVGGRGWELGGRGIGEAGHELKGVVLYEETRIVSEDKV